MFKEKEFNKILFITFILLIILTCIIFIIGQVSKPKVVQFEVNGGPQNTQIIISFNRIMNRASVESGFKMTPSINGFFAWSGKRLVFTPQKSLDYDTEYTIALNYAYDAENNPIQENFEKKIKTKTQSLYYISEDSNTKGYLLKKNLKDNYIKVIVADTVQTYDVSPDGSKVIYATGNTLSSKIIVQDMFIDNFFEIKIPKNLYYYAYDNIKVSQLLFGTQNIVILAQLINEQQTVSGKIVFIYDLSTTQIKLFEPENGLDNTDIVMYTPDYKKILFRDSEKNYAYADLQTGKAVLFERYLSINGFNYKQEKLAITDYDLSSNDRQYVGYVDSNRNKTDISKKTKIAQDPKFANTYDKLAYSALIKADSDSLLFGLALYDFAKDTENLIYSKPEFSTELPVWSPDDKYIAFEQYSKEQVQQSLQNNRIIFNTIKPIYGEIVVLNTETLQTMTLVEKGRDILWDK